MSDLPERWVRLQGWLQGPRIWRRTVAGRSPGLEAGDTVAVLGKDDEVLGWGLFHPRSQISVRIVRMGPEPFDDDWLRERAAAAVERRLGNPEIRGEVFRALHAEGDDFPALVVDRYGEVLAAEAYTGAARRLFETILPVLHAKLGTRHHRMALDRASARAEGETPFEEHSPGCPPRVRVEENGVRFEVDLREGHKTGFFCDQRDNRARLRRLVEGQEVLDVACYTGGFSLAAAGGGASAVTGIDLDEKALELAKRNANLNGLRIQFRQADAFSYLRTLGQNERRFGVVVLDPPKFIANRREEEQGIAKYHDLNKLALPLVADGGLLLSCSCSGLLSAPDFQAIVRKAARKLGRPVRIERITGAGPDHPVRLDFPEGAYLKALWLRVG